MTPPALLGRILPAAEAGLYSTAAEALDRARAEIALLGEQAAHDIEGERQSLLRDAATEAANARAKLLAETAAAARRTLASLETDIAEAIAQGVARIIGATDQGEAIAAAAGRALADLGASHGVAVHVNPAHAAHTRTALTAWGDGARVVADETLPQDACTIETPAGIIRAGLSEQLAILRTALLEACHA